MQINHRPTKTSFPPFQEHCQDKEAPAKNNGNSRSEEVNRRKVFGDLLQVQNYFDLV